MTAVPHPTTRSAPRWAHIATWVLQVGLAAMYLMSAVPKFLGDPTVVAGFAAIGFGPTGMAVIGVLEVLGAVGLVVARLAGVAAAALAALMVGAVLFTLAGPDPAAVVLPAVLLVLDAVVAWVRRDRTAELLRSVRG
ncbi:DoxX family protein [Pseudonocardia humida]|uniref:DoxX family protein n=1 Tax=Pseudonocardia humida TaxID=2800819 RepID=A0ABT0ZTF3_9PSEU|nr:DoxX family protein [Pseudonocardia humida]MCO1654011.1 DoxX family protein [Pseudonocardia humida]